jgi:ACT domain-containing protein
VAELEKRFADKLRSVLSISAKVQIKAPARSNAARARALTSLTTKTILTLNTMTIRQLSIFIENQSGTVQKVLELMKQSRIQIMACTIADTAEYGIFRIICSEPDRACAELKDAGVAVAISNVFAIELDNQPGGAADVVGTFSRAGIGITYLYAFLLNGRGILIFRTDKEAEAQDVIRRAGLRVVTERDLPVNA